MDEIIWLLILLFIYSVVHFFQLNGHKIEIATTLLLVTLSSFGFLLVLIWKISTSKRDHQLTITQYFNRKPKK